MVELVKLAFLNSDFEHDGQQIDIVVDPVNHVLAMVALLFVLKALGSHKGMTYMCLHKHERWNAILHYMVSGNKFAFSHEL